MFFCLLPQLPSEVETFHFWGIFLWGFCFSWRLIFKSSVCVETPLFKVVDMFLCLYGLMLLSLCRKKVCGLFVFLSALLLLLNLKLLLDPNIRYCSIFCFIMAYIFTFKLTGVSVYITSFSFFFEDGNGVVRGYYLSVFLELSAGLPETSK